MKLRIGPYAFELSRPAKVLFPDDGITKAELVDYYRRVGPLMLNHVRDRPVMMERFPDGIEAEGFIQKDVPRYFPEWIPRATVNKQGGEVTHAVCNNLAAIVYLAAQACITIHVWLSRVDRLDRPDQMIFDLDPGDDDFSVVRSAAVDLRQLCASQGLGTFVKTTGSRGAHVVVPLDRSAGFDEVRSFARTLAQALVSRDPGRRTTEARKDKRNGRLLVDVMRNAYGQPAVAPYAARPIRGAPVAMPLSWPAFERDGTGPRSFTLRNACDYLDEHGDAWADWPRRGYSLSGAGIPAMA